MSQPPVTPAKRFAVVGTSRPGRFLGRNGRRHHALDFLRRWGHADSLGDESSPPGRDVEVGDLRQAPQRPVWTVVRLEEGRVRTRHHARRVASADRSQVTSGNLVWEIDAARQSLDLATSRAKLPEPMCGELGRLLLLQKLQMSSRDLRRVEKVAFERDRIISRDNAIDLLVPADAPLVVDDENERYWLVPLSVMRRRTLVNLILTDEDGHRITTPGLRVVQQLDESVLLAAAAAALPSPVDDATARELEYFVRHFVAGERPDVFDMAQRLLTGSTPLMQRLANDELFMWAFGRLRHGYTLYVLLPVGRGRHRLLHMSFTEPTRWAYENPALDRPDPGDADPPCRYRTGNPTGRFEWRHWAARLGLRSTRIRFQVPSAEAAASYHFEVTAPPGVRLEKATLLAGRPNQLLEPVSLDRVEGHSPTIGLHVVEVPNGSCCRVQLDVGIPTRGWLTTMLASTWVILAALTVVSLPWTAGTKPWIGDEKRDLVVVLVTTSAGVAALIAHNDFGGEVAARLVAPVRVLGALSVTLPVIQAGLLVLAPRASAARTPWTWGEYAILACALVIVGLVTPAWARSFVSEHADRVQSPWDMTVDDGLTHLPQLFWAAVAQYDFHSPAVGVESAEAWHEYYHWSNEKQRQAIEALTSRRRPEGAREAPQCAHGRFACRGTAVCPTRHLSATPSPAGSRGA